MRIEGMDATSKTYDYTPEKVRVQPEVAQPTQAVHSVPEQETQSVRTDEKLVRLAVDKANKQMLSREVSIQFEAHDIMNEMIVRIIDKNTKEVIREIPSKKILDMVANMLEMAGLLVDEKR